MPHTPQAFVVRELSATQYVVVDYSASILAHGTN